MYRYFFDLCVFQTIFDLTAFSTNQLQDSESLKLPQSGGSPVSLPKGKTVRLLIFVCNSVVPMQLINDSFRTFDRLMDV